MSAARPTDRSDDVLPTLVPILRDRWFEPFRVPWRRRALATLWALLVVAMVVMLINDARSIDVGMPALLVGLLLNLTMRNMGDAPPDKLDERMVAVRNQAFRLAYYGIALAMVGLILGALVFGDPPVNVSEQQLIGIGWLVSLLAMFLPAAILAWTEEVV
ncbi:MAG: hypothetical protein AAF962_26300 [Actinomycetota bacterium]